MIPHATLVTRFAADLDALVAPSERIGVAVSGGPDSLALLLLAAAARPGLSRRRQSITACGRKARAKRTWLPEFARNLKCRTPPWP